MSPCCFAELRKEAVALLALINILPQREFSRRLFKIYTRDDVSGPLAVAHLLQQLLKISSAEDAKFVHSQIEVCRKAAQEGLRVRLGWEPYGMTPWQVVHYQPPKQMARYNSEPIINGPTHS